MAQTHKRVLEDNRLSALAKLVCKNFCTPLQPYSTGYIDSGAYKCQEYRLCDVKMSQYLDVTLLRLRDRKCRKE
jgi:hypothetical protein